MNYDLIIIGGGASGLCTAIASKKNNISVLILDHNSKSARKILSTGNGKCNLTNMYCKVDFFDCNPEGIRPYYTSGNNSFIYSVINQFDCDDTVSFFNDLGVLLLDKNGYIYPRSEQAASVRNILLDRCKQLGVDIINDYDIDQINYDREQYYRFSVNNEYFCRYLVIATGGSAAPKTGSDGSGFKLAKDLGHTIIKPIPALCGIKCRDPFFKDLAGVRNDSIVSLLDRDRHLIMQTHGNLQFTKYGISGIPVFQMSAEAGRLINAGKDPVIKIDLLPEFSTDDLIEHLNQHPGSLEGILNSNLAGVILDETSKDSYDHRNESFGERTVPVIKKFKVHPGSLNGFEDAQTTAGGVSTDEIDPETMMSRLTFGLYFTGEIIDVNGICGGYNLQWAWSTAHIAAADIINRCEGDKR